MAFLNNYYYQPPMGQPDPQNSQTQNSQMGNFGQQLATNAGIAGEGYAQGVAGQQDFSINPNAGLMASGKGLMQGGVVGAIVGGVSAQIGQFGELNKKIKSLDKGVNLYQEDPYGNPMYQGAAATEARQKMGALSRGEKSIKKGWYDPANAIFSGVFGTRRKLRSARRKIRNNLSRSQREFNEANITATQGRLGREQYNDMLSDPYGINGGYY